MGKEIEGQGQKGRGSCSDTWRKDSDKDREETGRTDKMVYLFEWERIWTRWRVNRNQKEAYTYLIRREKIKEANRRGNRNKHHRQDEEVTATRIEDGADNKKTIRQ
jgi:hypothetical protein